MTYVELGWFQSKVGGGKGSSRKLPPAEKQREQVLAYLLNTEKDFVLDMQVLMDVFISPLQEKGILKDKELEAILGREL